MNAVATRARAAKAKPAPVVSPLESVLSRIQSALDLISMAATVSSTGAHLAMLLVGLETEMLPNALTILRAKPVSKVDVASAYEKLLVPLSVLHAAGVLAKDLVMESTLQQAFEILDRAHSDMDSALVQHWPIPDDTEAPDALGDEITEPATTSTALAGSLKLWREAMVTAELSAGTDLESDVLRGAIVLMELAEKAVETAVTMGDADEASQTMCYGLAVLRIAQRMESDSCALGVSAAISLASIAKDGLDSTIPELPREVSHA